MATVQEVIADALRGLFNFIGNAVQYALGLLGVMIVTSLSLAGELIDDLTTYKQMAIDYAHLAKVMIPPLAIAVGAYIQHRKALEIALNTPAPLAQTFTTAQTVTNARDPK